MPPTHRLPDFAEALLLQCSPHQELLQIETMVPSQLTTDDSCRHDTDSRVACASRNRVTGLIAPPGSRCCGRVVNTWLPSRLGALPHAFDATPCVTGRALR